MEKYVLVKIDVIDDYNDSCSDWEGRESKCGHGCQFKDDLLNECRLYMERIYDRTRCHKCIINGTSLQDIIRHVERNKHD